MKKPKWQATQRMFWVHMDVAKELDTLAAKLEAELGFKVSRSSTVQFLLARYNATKKD